ncbi:MAG TPA: hypothetical protein VL173_03415 [Vicinamibacterales bacterium]|jgi:hypothetical protein|nr:hypothetical protein [Vicinamibacterales bacterium]
MRRRLLLILLAACCGACAKKTDNAKPVATPTVSIAQPAAAIESPVDVTYKFVVAPDAPTFDKDYSVFVHFNDPGGEQLWTDDHQPVKPTSQWKPGETIEYTRTMFVPKVAYTGATMMDVGLYVPGTNDRLPLAGTATGQRAYRVGQLEVRPQVGDTVVFYKSGWFNTEIVPDSPGTEWRWSKNEATFEFRNPRRDVTFMIDLDQPERSLTGMQQVELRDAAGQVLDAFTLAPGQRDVRRVMIPAAQLGTGDSTVLTLVVDRTFTPAYLPGAKSGDVRTLGVRVFHAYVQPK